MSENKGCYFSSCTRQPERRNVAGVDVSMCAGCYAETLKYAKEGSEAQAVIRVSGDWVDHDKGEFELPF